MNNSKQADSLELDINIEAEETMESEHSMSELLSAAHRRLDPALERIRRPRAEIDVIDSVFGPLMVAQGPRGLLAVRFLDVADSEEIPESLRSHFDLIENRKFGGQIADELERLMGGDATAVAGRAVDLSLVASEFQRRALIRLRRIPAGAVVTYQALAGMAGSPSAQRAIGNTVASNPIAIYVPCHRVIKSDLSIGNYGGGVERKLKLLRAEGFATDSTRRVPHDAVYGHLGTHIFCRPTCSAARRANRERMLIFPGPSAASNAGMRPCKLCRPT
jgi:O-6-methylguanine DNA methyltransferase